MDINIKRAFIFDPCLGDKTGHWENYCRRLYGELNNRGVNTTIFSHITVDPKITAGLHIVPVFTIDPYVDTSSTSVYWQEYEKVRENLSKINRGDFKSDDLLIFPTIFPQVLQPVLEWLSHFTPNSRPRVAIIFQFAAGNTKVAFTPAIVFSIEKIKLFVKQFIRSKLKSYERLMSKLDWAPNAQIDNYLHSKHLIRRSGCKFFAASEELAKNFSKLFNCRVNALPMPGPVLNSIELKSPSSINSEISVGYFGHAALSKGSHFLPEIIKNIHVEYPDLKFCVHVNPNSETEVILKKFDQLIKNVKCLYGHLGAQELIYNIGQVDITLLPYDASKYATTPSAICTESLSSGNVLIIPANTWMENQAKKYDAGYVTFDSFTVSSISQAIQEAIKMYPALKQKAIHAGQKFCNDNNVGIYTDKILSMYR